VQKVVNELIKAKKIKMLLNSQALLAFDRTDEKVNLTPEVVDLINKEQKK
jgi:Skp family chaperone for outer membrane proteins